MNITGNINEQLILLLYSLVLGAAFGAVYCLLKIIKTVFGGGTVVETVLNLIYFPFCTMIFFFFVVGFGGGAWRIYMIMGTLFGAVIYSLTLGKVLTDPVCFVIKKIKQLVCAIIRKIKEKIDKIDLKKKLVVLYNKTVYKRSFKYGTKGKSKKEQKQDN